jgi:hypothetical protein
VRKHAIIALAPETRQSMAESLAVHLTNLVREATGEQDVDAGCLAIMHDAMVELSLTHKFSTRLAAFGFGCKLLSCAFGMGGMPAAFVHEYARNIGNGGHEGRIG